MSSSKEAKNKINIPEQFNGTIPKFVAAPSADGNGFQLIDTSGLDEATLSLLARNLSGKVLTIDESQAEDSAQCNKARMINLIQPIQQQPNNQQPNHQDKIHREPFLQEQFLQEPNLNTENQYFSDANHQNQQTPTATYQNDFHLSDLHSNYYTAEPPTNLL